MQDNPRGGLKGTVTEMDVRGMICPLPVLRARKALAAMAPGDLLRVRCTDPAAASDFPAFCQTAGHVLVETGRQAPEGLEDPGFNQEAELIFLIRCGDELEKDEGAG
ncbi:MAG: sulfurtransferase TusA family protein [Alphaproteobacteria bacterium]|jgi:tRNA 2-thiouridine synthesizing protein A|nr:sulfurtransferase TusA family protein [Alphaproteobacteria bacterium]